MNNESRDSAGPANGERELPRRTLLSAVSLGLGAVGTALVGVPVLGFILAPVFRKRPQVWRKVGSPEEYKIGETVNVVFVDAEALPWDGVSARSAAWLRRETEDEFIAFSLNCTHLGCPVRWEPGANLFMCPCHGGVYYRNGDVAAGPPPRALFRYPVRVRDGAVEIRTEPIPMV